MVAGFSIKNMVISLLIAFIFCERTAIAEITTIGMVVYVAIMALLPFGIIESIEDYTKSR